MYYIDDPEQLPELPDYGPRDGRHGVDRDLEYDPYPHRNMTGGGGALTVSVEEARRHFDWILKHVEEGETVVLTSHGHPVAQLERHLEAASRAAAVGAAAVMPVVPAGVASATALTTSAGRPARRSLRRRLTRAR